MLFNSISFLLFFPIVCIVYYLIPSKYTRRRVCFLLLASYYFYMNWKAEYALILFAITIITYLTSLGISRCNHIRVKRLLLLSNIFLIIGILFYFKYYNFLAVNIEHLLSSFGLGIEIPEFKLLLPIGISFYTFKALGYSIDVYRGKTAVERDFLSFALFVSFFPQLAAGPIDRANNLLPQLHQCQRFEYENFMKGIKIMLWGYFLKLALADRCGIYVDTIFNHLDYHNGGSYLVASFLFAFQIYGDFAGYSLIAIGVAKVMGFDLMENFRRPYFASSVGEFWHRWHISLSTWFRDYVYIPLGGSRVSKARCYFNLLITFLISGIWHGANWTFIIWGGLHGILLCVEKALAIGGKKHYIGINRLVHCIITFVLISITWVFFRADSLSDAIRVVTGIITNPGTPKVEYAHWLAIIFALIILVIKEVKDEFQIKISIIEKHHGLYDHICIIFMICYILLFGVLGSDQFIYFQF